MDFTQPDVGIKRSLHLSYLPEKGIAVVFGFGGGENICFISANMPQWQCIGYETDHWRLAKTHDVQWELPNLRAEYGNALKIILAPQKYALAIVGMIMYNPKCIVREFMAKLWPQILPGGILHLQFATIWDYCADEDFVKYHCLPDGKDPHSYVYKRPFYCVEHEGVMGGSFWTLREVRNILQTLQPFRLVHFKRVEFTLQDQYGDDVHRSFYHVTIQKPSE